MLCSQGREGKRGGGVGGLRFKSVRKVQIRPQFDYHKNTQYLPITFKTEYPTKELFLSPCFGPLPFPNFHECLTAYTLTPPQRNKKLTLSCLTLRFSLSFFFSSAMNSVNRFSLSFIFSMPLKRTSFPYFMANSLNVAL